MNDDDDDDDDDVNDSPRSLFVRFVPRSYADIVTEALELLMMMKTLSLRHHSAVHIDQVTAQHFSCDPCLAALPFHWSCFTNTK